MVKTDWVSADYVVVGGGSAGSVMAARLSEDPSRTVALLEAGPEQRDLRLAVPAMLGEVLGSKLACWDYATVPQEHLGGRRLRWPRGKVMGGSSAINGMCYQRGDLADYDDWARLGAEGWGAAEALHFFKRSETHSEGESQWHGSDGPLHVTRPKSVERTTEMYLEAGRQMGLPVIEEFAAPNREGVGIFDTTTKGGRRCSAATAYLTAEVRARPNLTIVTEAQARRVLFDGTRAAGVEYDVRGVRKEAAARREVVLCAGAIGTPHLLMLSGVGPADHLAEHGIGVVADRSAVGANMADHLDVMAYRLTRPGGSVSYTLPSLFEHAGALGQYLKDGTGTLASNLAEGNGFLRSSPDAPRPDIQFHFIPGLAMDHGERKNWGRSGVSVHACNLYPESRGTIRLTSRDPQAPPLIDPNYLSAERDWDVMVAAARAAREVLSQPVWDEIGRGFVRPEHAPDTEEGWRGLVRDEAETIYHPVGTARMGRAEDEDAATDTMGLVHDTEGLRIVDASLFPSIPGGNTNAPTIMVAERIAARGLGA